jgi:hypothetical protein
MFECKEEGVIEKADFHSLLEAENSLQKNKHLKQQFNLKP